MARSGHLPETWFSLHNAILEGTHMPPIYGNGKICYIESLPLDMPAPLNSTGRFLMEIKTAWQCSTAFDDGVGEVSGTWVLGRPPSVTPGLLIYIMVDSGCRHD